MYGNTNSASPLNNTYRIEARLGSGGSGAVYKAWHKRLQKNIVLKELKDSPQRAVEAQRNEIEALKNIKNMFIPQVFDFLTEGGNSFTVMEYIEGDSFDKLLREGGRFSEVQVAKWYCQLAVALDAIHKSNVCHRDIKPGNIMLMPTGNVCLIDFNNALVSGNNTKVASRSFGYASPEQLEYYEKQIAGISRPCAWVKSVDWKLSDIYSLGATMYHILSGKRPPLQTDEVIIKSELRRYEKAIARIIQKSMCIDPLKRYASAQELQNDLQKLSARYKRFSITKLYLKDDFCYPEKH